MRTLWRALPDLALPLALGLALAYLGTGFVPRPAPSLRPPEDLRAQGQGYAEESPVRVILERNVLGLETAVFEPSGQPPRPEPAPAPAPPAPQSAAPAAPLQHAAPQPPQAGFAPVEPAVKPAQAGPGGVGASSVSEPLSGGPSVQGRIAAPASQPAPVQAAPSAPGEQPAQPQGAAPRAGADTPRPAAQRPAAPAQPSAAPAPSLSGIRLVGVIAGGAKPLAMLSVDGQALSLELGGQVRGWTLQSVEPGQIVLRSGEHTRRLTLGGSGQAPAGPAPQAP